MKARNMLIAALMIWSSVIAQEDDQTEKIVRLEDKIEGFKEPFLETKANVDKLVKIKVSGYAQTQMRFATDTSGVGKNKQKIGQYQGGALLADQKHAFEVRRGRLKVAYETGVSTAVVQFDATPKGVSIKDAYLHFSAPWLKGLALKGGVYDRPFGFEISYSSSSRESPERARIFQVLFPGERDLGFGAEYTPPENIPFLNLFNAKFGWFAGNGINVEFDDVRDLIGRLGISIPLNDVNLAVNAGFSGYAGGVRSLNDTVKVMKDSVVNSLGRKNKDIDRHYYGGDLQIYYGNIPVLGGLSLRGEVIGGQQPGRSGSNESPKAAAADSSIIQVRDFVGYYGIAVLNIDPLKLQLVGKYDYFDPNTSLEKKQVKNVNDAAFKTLGLGLVYHWDENVKIIFYYDKVTNEETGIDAYKKDVNDNVLTLRFQYKF